MKTMRDHSEEVTYVQEEQGELLNPFGAPFFIEQIENGEEIADRFCDLARQLRSEEDNGGMVSNAWREAKLAKSQEDYEKYGFTSFATSNLIEDSRADFLHEAITKQMGKFLDIIATKKSYLTIINSWATIYGEGHYVPEHIHPNAQLSCVFYGDASPDTGKLVFKNPMYQSYAMNYDQRFGLYCDSFFVQPKKGMMVIFPSFLPHYTTAHEDKKERIICSANANLSTDRKMNEHFSQDGKGNKHGE